MEITPANAFYISVKLTIHPFLPIYILATEIAQEKINKVISYLLEKPTHTTIVALVALSFITIAITISCIFVSGITCLVIILTMVESTVFMISFLTMINISTIIIFLTLVISVITHITSK